MGTASLISGWSYRPALEQGWVFENLEPEARYYFHFINTGGIGVLSRPRATASWNSEEECTVEPPEENDDDTSDTDSGVTDSTDTADNDPDTGSDTADTDSADSGSGDTANTNSNDSGSAATQEGKLGGKCRQDNTCDDGLICQDSICVEESDKKSGGCSVLSID